MDKKYDIFISHASEDKDAIVRPLATILERLSVRVWYDETKSEVQVRLKELHVTDKNAVKGSISKFELFLLSEGKELSDSITFLRNLQELRSSTTAHRKSRNKKSPCEDYFQMGSRSQQEVLEVIFNKGIEMLEAVKGDFVK